MYKIYYYFIKDAVTGKERELPYVTEYWFGGIGDGIILNGIKYIITDYAVEDAYWEDLREEAY